MHIEDTSEYSKYYHVNRNGDKTITCKNGLIYVITKRNKGTIAAVCSDMNKAEEIRNKIGGDKFYRINTFIINQETFK